jgi:hypothetical protein
MQWAHRNQLPKIIAANADYVFSLKDNHPTLHQEVKNWFEATLWSFD